MLHRPYLSLGSLMLMIILLLSGCANSQAERESVSMFRGNLQHTGVSASKGPEQFNGVKWRFQTDGYIRSSPVLSNDTLYFGSEDKNFYAVEASTGELKWKYATQSAITSTAAIMDNVVYVYGGDEYLYALNEDDGSLHWKFQTDGVDKIRDKVDYWKSSPAVYNNIVYFGGGESTLYAVNASDGTLAWKNKVQLNGYECNDCAPFLHASPAVYDGVVYVGVEGYDMPKQQEPGNIFAFDAATGKQLWVSDYLAGAVDSSPVIDDQAIYFGMRNNGLEALDRETGKPIWHSYAVPYVLASPALHQGILYSGSSDSKELIAFDLATKDVTWSFKAIGPIHASPTIDGTSVYFAAGNHYTDANQGIVYAVDASTGKEKWQYQTGGNIYSSPIVNQGVLFIGSDDGFLYAIH